MLAIIPGRMRSIASTAAASGSTFLLIAAIKILNGTTFLANSIDCMTCNPTHIRVNRCLVRCRRVYVPYAIEIRRRGTRATATATAKLLAVQASPAPAILGSAITVELVGGVVDLGLSPHFLEQCLEFFFTGQG